MTNEFYINSFEVINMSMCGAEQESDLKFKNTKRDIPNKVKDANTFWF